MKRMNRPIGKPTVGYFTALFVAMLSWTGVANADPGFHGFDLAASGMGVVRYGMTPDDSGLYGHEGYGFALAVEPSFGFGSQFYVGGSVDYGRSYGRANTLDADFETVSNEFSGTVEVGLTRFTVGHWVRTDTGDVVSTEYSRARLKLGFGGGYTFTSYGVSGSPNSFADSAAGPHLGLRTVVLLSESVGAEFALRVSFLRAHRGQVALDETVMSFGIGLIWLAVDG